LAYLQNCDIFVSLNVFGIDRNNKNRLLCRFYIILMLATQGNSYDQ